MPRPDWVPTFNEAIQAWDGKYIITSPDVDGMLSACLLGNEFGAKLVGVYTTRYLILFDDVSPREVKNALWLDHDISEEGIQCMGQHLVNHSQEDKLPKRGAYSFNPNQHFNQSWKDSFHGSNMKQGKRDKYPYATVHFLMAGLGIADPAKYTDHFHLLAHADGSWATCVDYRLNTMTWKNTMFGDEAVLVNVLNSNYTDDERNLVGHRRIVDELVALGVSKRTSKSASSSLIPPDWRGLQGKQSISYRKNSDPQEWLSQFNGVLSYISRTTQWQIVLPKRVTEMHRGMVLELSNRGEVKDGDFDQFMYDEDIFSHAITGAGTMRFTKRIKIRSRIESHETIPILPRLPE
jgi:hypothetical protein